MGLKGLFFLSKLLFQMYVYFHRLIIYMQNLTHSIFSTCKIISNSDFLHIYMLFVDGVCNTLLHVCIRAWMYWKRHKCKYKLVGRHGVKRVWCRAKLSNGNVSSLFCVSHKRTSFPPMQRMNARSLSNCYGKCSNIKQKYNEEKASHLWSIG